MIIVDLSLISSPVTLTCEGKCQSELLQELLEVLSTCKQNANCQLPASCWKYVLFNPEVKGHDSFDFRLAIAEQKFQRFECAAVCYSHSVVCNCS